MEYYFDHEKLDVYQLAISFAGWCEDILQRCSEGIRQAAS